MFSTSLRRFTFDIPFGKEEEFVLGLFPMQGVDEFIYSDFIFQNETEALLRYKDICKQIQFSFFTEYKPIIDPLGRAISTHITKYRATLTGFKELYNLLYEPSLWSCSPSIRREQGNFPCYLQKLEWSYYNGWVENRDYYIDYEDGLVLSEFVDQKLYSLQEAAQKLNISRNALNGFLNAGKIQCVQINGRRKILSTEMEKVMKYGIY